MPSAVTVEHLKRKDLRLEKVLLQDKPSDNEVMGRAEISPRRKCAMITPPDGQPYIYEAGGFFTIFRADSRRDRDLSLARTECRNMFDRLCQLG